MKSVKQIIKNISFSSYFKKVDPAVKAYISTKGVKHIPLIVTFRCPLNNALEAKLKRLGFKVKYHFQFLNGMSGKIPTASFDSLCSIVEIQKLYYDGKAYLMGEAGMVDAENTMFTAKKTFLSGKGVCAAFIDSGVYPHPDLIKPRNRIAAFKDFINELEAPYDDNGHGTACIGAAFGASAEGKFKSPAYDSGIVCAKAFNSLSVGSYSDILAAMQWVCSIRDKYNIKIIVLPFGTPCAHRSHDILGLAASVLWQYGFFVCTCSGNLGPGEGSITSPGIESFSFTTGACNTTESIPRIAKFSGCGPVAGKTDKPDAVMPGYKVPCLYADTMYIPRNKSIPSNHSLNQYYTTASGTSISAALTAAAAALLYQKKGNLSPADVKSILKVCCTSLNESKTTQGAGMIDIKKIEEFQ